MSYETKWGNRIFLDIMAGDITPQQLKFICRLLPKDDDARYGDAHRLLTLIEKLEPTCSPEHAKAGIEWLRTNLLRKDGVYRSTKAGYIAQESGVGITHLLLDSITSVHVWSLGHIDAYDYGWVDDCHPIYMAKVDGVNSFLFGTRPWQSRPGLYLGLP